MDNKAMMSAELSLRHSLSPGAKEIELAHGLAKRLPQLVLEARRIATNLGHGIHGRRCTGAGESFWQFRPYQSGEAATRIDWRRSARDGKLYVRERESEASQAIELWIDRSASMAYASNLAGASKVERAIILGLALAEVLVTGGERVGYMGGLKPNTSKRISEQISQTLAATNNAINNDLPPALPLRKWSEALIISDFLAPLKDIECAIASITSHGARGHAVVIVDPVEETFPFTGQTELVDPEDGRHLHLENAAAWRDAYRQRIIEHRKQLRIILDRYNFTLTIHHTDRPASEAALRILSLIATRHRGVM